MLTMAATIDVQIRPPISCCAQDRRHRVARLAGELHCKDVPADGGAAFHNAPPMIEPDRVPPEA